jgi:serine/threonine protein kinase/DNA-binding NarL/FixJ family response regulator
MERRGQQWLTGMEETTRPPPRLADRYRVGERLGEGSMGIVYCAHDETLNRDVAIKFLSPERILGGKASARFLREARAVARLSHPNIVTLHDVGREGTWHYLVLEYIPGRDLHALMVERGGPLPVGEALHAIRGALEALAYAHAQGVIHRDVKPENIMLTPAGQVKVTDFGLALARGDVRLTQEGMIVGTLLYLAPETISGKPGDQRADLYALGAVSYELLTGQPPFTSEDSLALISQILHAPVTPPRSLGMRVPPQVERVVVKLLAKDPADRYGSAEEVLAALPLPESAETAPRLAHEPLIHAALEDTKAVEAERRRLAELLRRSLVEPLNLLLSQANVYEQTLGANPTARVAVSVLASLARQVLQQVRDLEANLHPSILETAGLEPALEGLASQTMRAHGLQIRLALKRMPERLPPEVELALFRAAQDALERAIRHAHASQVTMRLEYRDARLVLHLSDNGVGTAGGETLRAARQRIEQLGGTFDTSLGPHGGLELKVGLPIGAQVELTPREMEIIQLLAEGLSNKEIAGLLFISPRTVNFHLDNIYSKLGVSSRTEAAIHALRHGWVRRPATHPG